jgi:hypothetical protein
MHHLDCEAPLCQSDPNQNWKHEVLWYPGERVCQKAPYQKFQKKQQFQKKQLDINFWVAQGKFRKTDIPLTADALENRSI